MDYQWYPGHMTKARRMMQEDMKLVDLVIELTDARIPLSSRNPDIDELGRGKYRLVLLNKADLADEQVNRSWRSFFDGQGIRTVLLDARERSAVRAVTEAVTEVCAEKKKRDLARGIKNRPVRAMVAGIPNVGKSTFINSLAGKAVTKTGNKPGVTRGRQWIRMNREIELLDTPGLLWPKFEDPRVGLHLALIGSVNDEILQVEELALELLEVLKQLYPGILSARYGFQEEETDGAGLLEEIAKARGCLKKAEEPDYAKAARLLLDDFRSGRLGRISLDRPDPLSPL